MSGVTPCVGGQCSGGGVIMCGRHGSERAVQVMTDRGWVLIDEYGDSSKELEPHFLSMVHAVQLAGVELERWFAGWDHPKQVPKYGVWAPRVVAAILGLLAKRLAVPQLVQALKAAKIDPQFAAAVDAAWRFGGAAASDAMVVERLPQLAEQINAAARKR